MSLDWGIDKIRDWEAITMGSDVEGPITHSMVWMTMVLDMGIITEKNWKEFYARSKLYAQLAEEEPFFKLEDVHRRIGLRTNVITKGSTRDWVWRIAKRNHLGSLRDCNYWLKEKV